ncbi:MAG: phage tail spike protein [Lachnospiraceae bacterium]
MYRVTITNNGTDTEIHSPHANSIKVESTSLKIGINSINSFVFKIYPDNPGYGLIQPLKTLIKVTDTISHEDVFDGRVLSPTESMGSDGALSKSYVCESELGYLHDSVQSYRKVQNTTPEAFLTYLIGIHNAQVESYKQFAIGTVGVTNSTDNVYYYVDPSADTYDTIMDKLIDNLGGELQIRKANGTRYLDWISSIGETKETEIRLARNLIEMQRETDPTEVITRLFPRGAATETTSDTDAAKPRLTIKSVNNGKEYIDNAALIETFGIQGGVVTWDNVTVASNLLTKAQTWLAKQGVATDVFDVSAVDLSLLGLDADAFKVGNAYRIVNPILGVSAIRRITEINININNPSESSLTFGTKNLTLSQYQSSARKAQKAISNLQSSVSGQTGTNEQLEQSIAEVAGAAGSTANDIVAIKNKTDALKTGAFTQIQKGSVDVATSGAGTYNATITFPTAFTAAPHITPVIRGALPQYFNSVLINTKTTTQATVYFYKSSSGSSTVTIDWVATLPE